MKHSAFTHKKTAHGITLYVHKKNDLTVIVYPIPGCGAVTVNTVYMVGSRHETPGKTGLAHILEHMMFKPTKDARGIVRKIPGYVQLQNKGAELNATTSEDRTNYYFTLPKAYLGEILEVEAERMRSIVLTEKEFNPEKQNVLSEFEMYADQPLHALYGQFLQLLFPSHGYGHDVIGYRTDLEALTCADLRAFYDHFYWPNNATVVVVGDVTPEDALKEIDRTFGHIPKSPHRIESPQIHEVPLPGHRHVSITRPNQLQLHGFAIRGVSAQHPLWGASRIFLAYMMEGRLSHFYKELVEKHLVSSVTPLFQLSHDPYVWGYILTLAKNAKRGDVEKKAKALLYDHAAKHIPPHDLTRIKNALCADIEFSRDGTAAVAHDINECIASGDPYMYGTMKECIENTTNADIETFAREYIQNAYGVTGDFIGSTS